MDAGSEQPENGDSTAAEGADGDDELTRRIAQEAAQLPSTARKDEDDDDWAVDTSAAAVAARMKELAVQGAVAKLMDDEDDLMGAFLISL